MVPILESAGGYLHASLDAVPGLPSAIDLAVVELVLVLSHKQSPHQVRRSHLF